jgi:hypothetical protein
MALSGEEITRSPLMTKHLQLPEGEPVVQFSHPPGFGEAGSASLQSGLLQHESHDLVARLPIQMNFSRASYPRGLTFKTPIARSGFNIVVLRCLRLEAA